MTEHYLISIPPEPPEPDTWGHGWNHSLAWCEQHVGEQGVDWWYRPGGIFCFLREQDCTMFRLRWA